MVNPWSTATSAEEAAQGAGVETFTTPVGMETSLGLIDESWATYSYMEGVAEAQFPVAAVECFARKGVASAAVDGDISGDYNVYKNTWTTEVNGNEITCFGNREGEATKSIWTSGDYCYSLLAMGAGGDDDFGLSAEALEEFVGAIS